jgi:glycosyltransferase involved in cell wall biosynthesis
VKLITFNLLKKLLILAYDFPPYVSVGGLRPYNWFRYLKEYGVEPIVITRQWQNTHGNQLDYISAGYSPISVKEKTEFGTIIRTPYTPNLSNRLLLRYGEHKFRFIRKAISGFYEFAQFLYPVGPKSEIYAAARAYLKENKVDAIIATGDPFVLFQYAAQLSKEFGIPWIADYRDPWSHNQEHQKFFIQKWWNQLLEKRSVSTAVHIATVSTFVHQKIDSLIPNKPYSILPNGYDPEIIDSVQYIPQASEKLNIGFVGTIYEWHPLESFLRVCEAFVKEQPDVKLQLNFYGTNLQEKLTDLVEQNYPSLLDHLYVSPRMPNEEVLRLLAANNVVLLFNYYSYMGTKIFDYLGIRRKMLLCYTKDKEALELKRKYYRIQELESESGQLQADLINATHSGIVVKDAEHLQVVLNELWEEFAETGMIRCDSVGVEKYSRKIQVEKLAGVLTSIHPPSSDTSSAADRR